MVCQVEGCDLWSLSFCISEFQSEIQHMIPFAGKSNHSCFMRLQGKFIANLICFSLETILLIESV